MQATAEFQRSPLIVDSTFLHPTVSVLLDHALKNLRFGFELLCKLLMQEYCRYRGFQLAGFRAFLEARRRLAVGADGDETPTMTVTKQEDGTVTERHPSMSVDDAEPDKEGERGAKLHAADETSNGAKHPSNLQMISTVGDRNSGQKAATVTASVDEQLLQKKTKSSLVACPDDLGNLSFYECLLIDILQRLSHPELRPQ